MGQVAVITMERSKSQPLELSDAFTEASYNPFLVKDAVVYQRAKLRQGTHSTKTRSQVAGSTRKLYRQKGTGSARVGDRAATQRRGGGRPHGPKPRSHAIKLNKKVRKSALLGAVAEKLRQGQLLVLDTIAPKTHKTKAFAVALASLDALDALIVTHEIGETLERAARNLPGVVVVHFGQVNVYNLLLYDKVLVTRQAMLALQERLTA